MPSRPTLPGGKRIPRPLLCGRERMHDLEAIGFDLFNTLMTVHPMALQEAMRRLVAVLKEEDLPVEGHSFGEAYLESARSFLQEARQNGRETHNRFWVATALERQGCTVAPDDIRIARAVEAYFSAFDPHCRLVPGTREMLGELAGRYRLGLLSNFTHPPAVRRILDGLELRPFFRTVLISGDLGYRKPHPYPFERLLAQLSVPAARTLFVGDDPRADVLGAMRAGIRPVLTTCVFDQRIPNAETPMSAAASEPLPDVPSISSWQDLLDLLAV